MRTILALVLLVGCASDDSSSPPRGCDGVMKHFYDAGCTFVSASGTPISEDVEVVHCEERQRSCGVTVTDDWLQCLGAVDNSAQCTVCMTQTNAVETCH